MPKLLAKLLPFSCDAQGKRCAGDLLVPNRPDFRGLFRFSNKLEFWIFGSGADILEIKRVIGDPLVPKRPEFWGLFKLSKFGNKLTLSVHFVLETILYLIDCIVTAAYAHCNVARPLITYCLKFFPGFLSAAKKHFFRTNKYNTSQHQIDNIRWQDENNYSDTETRYLV